MIAARIILYVTLCVVAKDVMSGNDSKVTGSYCEMR